MKTQLIVIFQMIIQIQSYITFDQGFNEYFNAETGYQCSNSQKIKTTVTFSGTFENPPQILIFPRTVSVPNNPPSNFTVDIWLITTEYFQINISCISNGIVKYLFNWYALNDDKISILSKPSETNCVDQSIYTHSHNLRKAKQAIVILQSWGMYAQDLNFYLEIYEVNSTTVKIKLHNFNSNLMKIGYQILLGTSETFIKSGLIESPGGKYTLLFKSTPKLNKGMLFIPLAGFYWRVQDNIRIQLISQQVLDNFQYVCQSCINVYYQVSATYMDSIRFSELWLFEQILFPMYVYSYRVTKKYERYVPNLIKISIIELNTEFNSIGEFEISDIYILTLTIEIELKFFQGEMLVGSFLKCNECGSKNVFKIEQNYLGGYNFIRYRLLLRQNSISALNFLISIGLSSLTIKQQINQVVEDYQIVQLQFLNQSP